MGLVFGDIGTSPIYTLTVVFALTKPTLLPGNQHQNPAAPEGGLYFQPSEITDLYRFGELDADDRRCDDHAGVQEVGKSGRCLRTGSYRFHDHHRHHDDPDSFPHHKGEPACSL